MKLLKIANGNNYASFIFQVMDSSRIRFFEYTCRSFFNVVIKSAVTID